MIGSSHRKTSEKAWKNARKYIASGVQTYSKAPERYVNGVYPKFIDGGKGCYVYSETGKTYIDYVCALGAITLGYAHPYVDECVAKQMRKGIIFSLPSTLEYTLAKLINSQFPAMEKMRFFKSGSEAVSAGIKIARAYTGRDLVLSSGYHGWHDWSTPITEKRGGTPQVLSNTIESMTYGDIDSIKAKIRTKKVACVVLDAYTFTAPSKDYFKKLINLCHRHGTLVFFDEVVTGIRWQTGSVHTLYGVKPDLVAFGKGMANGYPISVLGGKCGILDVVDNDCFVSTTFGGDLVGITAAIATMKVAKDEALDMHICDTGIDLQAGYNILCDTLKLPTKCSGNPARLRVSFPTTEHKALFWQECVRRGVFLGDAFHTNLSHTNVIIDKTLDVFRQSLNILKKHFHRPGEALLGRVPQSVLRR